MAVCDGVWDCEGEFELPSGLVSDSAFELASGCWSRFELPFATASVWLFQFVKKHELGTKFEREQINFSSPIKSITESIKHHPNVVRKTGSNKGHGEG